MSERLQGKTMLITGGTSGIGLAVAELFAKQQAKVAVNGRDNSKSLQALGKIREVNKGAIFVQGDVSRYDECQCIVRKTVEQFGRLDIVVNSAGVYLEKPVTDMTEADFHYIMNTNLAGTYWICKFAAKELQKATGGAIVNIASDAGLKGNLLCTAYCAAKGAVIAFTKALALELVPYGIRVNCVF